MAFLPQLADYSYAPDEKGFKNHLLASRATGTNYLAFTFVSPLYGRLFLWIGKVKIEDPLLSSTGDVSSAQRCCCLFLNSS